jgi:hypothetical protein
VSLYNAKVEATVQSVQVCSPAKPAAVTGLAFSPVTASLVATCSGERRGFRCSGAAMHAA